MNHTRTNPKFLSPCRNALRLALECDISVGSSVPGLKSEGYPMAVFRGVRTVIVDAIHGKAGSHARCHILLEVCKVLPSVTNLDSPASVVLEHGVVWILAPRFHAAPCSVQAGLPSGLPVSSAVSVIALHEPLRTVAASAGLRVTSHQTVAVWESDFAAIAFALPSGLFSRPAHWGNGDEFAEPLASNVIETRAPFVFLFGWIHGAEYTSKTRKTIQETALALPCASQES